MSLFEKLNAVVKPHNDLITARHILAELAEAADSFLLLVQVEGVENLATVRAKGRLQRAIARASTVTRGL